MQKAGVFFSFFSDQGLKNSHNENFFHYENSV